MASHNETWTVWFEKQLHEQNKLTNLLAKAETATGVKRLYIALGLIAFICLYMILGYGAELICNFIGFVYPAYKSIHALESVRKDDDVKWLTYWVVYAAFCVVEFFSDLVLNWFPFYWLVKVVFLIWCFAPIERNGSTVIYNRFLRPVFLKNREKIDQAVGKAMDKAVDLAGTAIQEAATKYVEIKKD